MLVMLTTIKIIHQNEKIRNNQKRISGDIQIQDHNIVF